ncbi:MAG: hypothetical protein U0790_25430 [Isosphaeraceae bacterium]
MELIVGDIRDGLEQDHGTYDVVLSSFAIHHLSEAEKAIFFARAADRLGAGGMLLLVDTMREEGEDRAAYLEGYCGWVRSTWVALAGRGARLDRRARAGPRLPREALDPRRDGP